jgi:hypothetical protein
MLESIIPATTVIDKPEIGVTSTESSISCIEYCTDCVTPAIGFLTLADFEAFEENW